MSKNTYTVTKFKQKSLELLAYCNQVIEQYQAQGYRLTLRQLYYQLVSQNIIENREREYKNIGSLVSKGRLAGYLDWDAIEDRIRIPKEPRQWKGPREIVKSAIEQYRLDRWDGQDYHVELWVEKDALAGVLAPIAENRHVTLMVNRGYSSQSAMYEAAQRYDRKVQLGKKGVILYLGDLDPSGEDMVRDIDDRLNDTFGVPVTVRKIAITPAQVDEFRPPPNPAKLSDTRAEAFIKRHGYESYEVDALPPEELNKIVNDYIDSYVDVTMYDEMIGQEEEDKERLNEMAEGLS